jgi:transcriptional regulator NrdR family protein
LVRIKIKAAASVGPDDVRGLKRLASIAEQVDSAVERIEEKLLIRVRELTSSSIGELVMRKHK